MLCPVGTESEPTEKLDPDSRQILLGSNESSELGGLLLGSVALLQSKEDVELERLLSEVVVDSLRWIGLGVPRELLPCGLFIGCPFGLLVVVLFDMGLTFGGVAVCRFPADAKRGLRVPTCECIPG